ncbi:MAG: hypothetical protein FWE90_13720 [Defluviitaleaceae bacterium]|nr:hypothetical protein [Defluviitaleaceae bacterium]
MAENKNMPPYAESLDILRVSAGRWREGPPDTPLAKQPGTIFDGIPFSTENNLYGAFQNQLQDAPMALVSDGTRKRLLRECNERQKVFDGDLEALKLLRFNTMVQQVEEYAYNRINHPERAKIDGTMFDKLPDGQQKLDDLVSTFQFDENYFMDKSKGSYGIIGSNDLLNIIDTLNVKEAKQMGELHKIVEKSVEADKEKGLWPPQQYAFRCGHFKGDRRETDKYCARVQSLLVQCGDLTDEDKQYGTAMFKRNFPDKDFDEIFIDGKSVNEYCIDHDMDPTDEEKMCLVTAHALDPKSKVDFRRYDPDRPDKRTLPTTLKPEMAPETKKYGVIGSALRWVVNFRNKEKQKEAKADLMAALGRDPNPERNAAYAEDINSGKAKKRRDAITNEYFVDRRTETDLLKDAVKDMSLEEPLYKSLYTLNGERLENIKDGALELSTFDPFVDTEEARINKDIGHVQSEIKFPGTKKKTFQTLNGESSRTMGALCRLGMMGSMHNPYGDNENAKKEAMKKYGDSLGLLLHKRDNAKGGIKDKDITDKQARLIADDVIKIMRSTSTLKMPDCDLSDPMSVGKHYRELNRLCEYGSALTQLHDALPPKVVKEITEGNKTLPGEFKNFMKTVDNLKTLNIMDPTMQVRGMSHIVIAADDATPAKEVLKSRDTVDKIHISQQLCKDLKGGFPPGKPFSEINAEDPFEAELKSDTLLNEAKKNKNNPDTVKQRTDMLENICLTSGRTKPELAKRQDDWVKDKANTDKHMEEERKAREQEQREREEKERSKRERKEASVKNAAEKKAKLNQPKVKLPSEKSLDNDGDAPKSKPSGGNVQRHSKNLSNNANTQQRKSVKNF